MTVAHDLPNVVARALASPVTDLKDVRREALAYDAFLSGRSLTRITGVALVDDGRGAEPRGLGECLE